MMQYEGYKHNSTDQVGGNKNLLWRYKDGPYLDVPTEVLYLQHLRDFYCIIKTAQELSTTPK